MKYKPRLALLALVALVLTTMPAATAVCQGFCTGQPCWGYGCPSGCICIQPDGPGTQGFCNGGG